MTAFSPRLSEYLVFQPVCSDSRCRKLISNLADLIRQNIFGHLTRAGELDVRN